MKSIITKNGRLNLLTGITSSILLKIESYWSLINLITNKNTEMNSLGAFDIIQMLVIGLMFGFAFSYAKKLKRKNEYLAKILFERTEVKFDTDDRILKQNIDSLPQNYDPNSEEGKQRAMIWYKMVLDCERRKLVDYFNDVYKDKMTKKEIENEIESLYNNPFGYFK